MVNLNYNVQQKKLELMFIHKCFRCQTRDTVALMRRTVTDYALGQSYKIPVPLEEWYSEFSSSSLNCFRKSPQGTLFCNLVNAISFISAINAIKICLLLYTTDQALPERSLAIHANLLWLFHNMRKALFHWALLRETNILLNDPKI